MIHQAAIYVTRTKAIFLFFVSSILFCHSSFPQQNKIIDSLLRNVTNAKNDTSKVNALNELSKELRHQYRNDEAKNYANEALSIAEKQNFKKGIAGACTNIGSVEYTQNQLQDALNKHLLALKLYQELGDKVGIAVAQVNIGNVHLSLANYSEALKRYNDALVIRQEIGFKQGVAACYRNIAIVYKNQFDYPNALKNYLTCIKIAEEIEDNVNIGNSYREIALIYRMQGNYTEAVKNNAAALKIFEELGNKRETAGIYNNNGNIFLIQGNYPAAVKNFLEALKVYEEFGDKKLIASVHVNIGIISEYETNYAEALKNFFYSKNIFTELNAQKEIENCYNAIGNVYFYQNDYDESLKNHLAALSIAEGIADKSGIAVSHIDIGVVYREKHNYSESMKNLLAAHKELTEIGDKTQLALVDADIGEINIYLKNLPEAKKYLDEALLLANETGNKEYMKLAYEKYALLDSVDGKFKDAYQHYKLAAAFKDSLLNETSSRQIAQIKEQYESEKKDNEIAQLENEKKISALLLKNKTDSLNIAESEKQKIKLENEKMQTLNLFDGQQITLLNNDKRIQQLQIDKDKAESDKNEERLFILSKEKTIQQLEANKQRQTKNYLIASLALFMLLSFFIYRNYYTRQQLKLQKLRNKIASDLHDDVGSTLSSISIFSQMAQEQSKEVMPLLQTIGDSSRKMLDAMADIVWTINPENDQFEKIILRMRSFAYELLGAKQIEFRFVADSNISNMKLPMEARRNLYLIFKEATNNLVKYSGASRAMFNIKGENGKLVMMIKDDGKGFDSNKESQGNGLRNMKKRANEMGAVLMIDSIPGSGTTIKLEMAV